MNTNLLLIHFNLVLVGGASFLSPYGLFGDCLFISYRFVTYTLTLHNEITL